MRETTQGLHKGTPIKVRGMGKLAAGTVSREPEDGATHVMYRCQYNLGERLVPITNVRIVRGPRL